MNHHAGFGPVFPWGAILALAAIVVGVPTVCIAAAVAWRTRGPKHRGGPASGGRRLRRVGLVRRGQQRRWPVPEGYRNRVRAGRLAGAAVGAAAGVALVVSFKVYLAPVACVGGYMLGVLSGELWASTPPQGSVREARLTFRRPSDFMPTWAAVAAVGGALPVVAAPAVFALAPRVSYGPWHPDRYAPSLVLAGGRLAWPAPGLTITLAALAAAGLLLAALSVKRVADAPALGDISDPDADRWWRRSAGRATSGAALGIVALCLGSLLIAASSGLAVPGDPTSTASLASRVMVWAGAAVIVGGLVAWLVLDGPSLAPPAPPPPSPTASPAG